VVVDVESVIVHVAITTILYLSLSTIFLEICNDSSIYKKS
jgi:hypothetical protein